MLQTYFKRPPQMDPDIGYSDDSILLQQSGLIPEKKIEPTFELLAPPPPPPPIEPMALKSNEMPLPLGIAIAQAATPLLGNIASKLFPKRKKAAQVVAAVPDLAERVITAQGNTPFAGASTPIRNEGAQLVGLPTNEKKQWYKTPAAMVGGGIALLLFLFWIFKRKKSKR